VGRWIRPSSAGVGELDLAPPGPTQGGAGGRAARSPRCGGAGCRVIAAFSASLATGSAPGWCSGGEGAAAMAPSWRRARMPTEGRGHGVAARRGERPATGKPYSQLRYAPQRGRAEEMAPSSQEERGGAREACGREADHERR
jgi:hypothetical protein